MNEDINVLVVDDEESIRGMFSEVLLEEGYGVATASSGEQALDLFRRKKYQIVFTDIRMGGISGLDLLKELKPLVTDVQVVMITSYASMESTITAMREGAYDYLVKPFESIDLISVVAKRAADRYRLIKQNKRLEESNQAYQLQEEANEKLKKLNNMKENFITLTSHELNTPLAILSICADMMNDEEIWPLNEMQKEVTVNIRESISRLKIVVQKINEMSCISEERLSLERKIIDVLDIVGFVLEYMDLIIKQRNIDIQVKVKKGIAINVDAGLIQEVLAEIVLNAVRHTPDGGNIEINCEERDGETIISVADSGQGIPDEKKDNIFDTFSSVGNHMYHTSGIHEHGSGGLGVGLAIAKGIVEAHGGKIWVEDSSGDANNGAKATLNTFSFSIPYGFDDK